MDCGREEILSAVLNDKAVNTVSLGLSEAGQNLIWSGGSIYILTATLISHCYTLGK